MSWRVSLVVALVIMLAIVLARLGQDPETGTATWDASRAAGFATYLLLWASTLTGIAVHFRLRPGGGPLTLMLESHRICSTLAMAFVAGHVVALLLDPIVHFSLIDGFVPFTSAYRPVQVGAGTAAMWLLVAVLWSTAAANRYSYVRWHAVHVLAYPCFVAALAHGITAGTDSGNTVAVAIYALTAASVAAAGFARILGRGWVSAGEAQSSPG